MGTLGKRWAKRTAVTGVHTTPETKKAFHQLCKQEGIAVSEMLNNYMERRVRRAYASGLLSKDDS